MDTRLLKHYRRISYDHTEQPVGLRETKEVARRFERVGEAIYSRMFVAEIGSKIPINFNPKHVVENAFFSTLTDLDKKLRRKEYYQTNAQLFLRYMRQTCDQIRRSNPVPHDRLSEFLFESSFLLQEHNVYASTNPFDYGVGKNEYTEYFRIFPSSVAITMGQPVSNINFGTATLRMSIENRLRSALGVLGVHRPSRNEIARVKFSELMSVMKLHEGEIDIDVDLDILNAVYSWSNNYIHSSFRTFPWLVMFAHDVVQPLFRRVTLTGKSSGMKNNIRISKNTLLKIRKEILAPHIAVDPASNIYGYHEDDCYVAFV